MWVDLWDMAMPWLPQLICYGRDTLHLYVMVRIAILVKESPLGQLTVRKKWPEINIALK
jgi:hypothetical protein